MRCVNVRYRFLLVIAFAAFATSPALSNVPVVRPALLVVDLQQHFIADATFNPATATALKISEQLVRTAGSASIPIYVTYESANDGDHAMPAAVKEALPPRHRAFFKTKYAASDLPALVDQLERSGITHVVIIGAETDVCVLLTALGLRQLGYNVLLVKDAVISPERNVQPALERMRQAGVHIGDQRDAARLMAGKAPAVAVEARPRKLAIKPFKNGKGNVALVVNIAGPGSVDDSCGAASRRARLDQLSVLADWLELPVFVNSGTGSIVSERAGSGSTQHGFSGAHVRAISELDPRQYGFIVLAGHESGMRSVLSQLGLPRRLFVVTDAILPGSAPDHEGAAALDGFVPLTYKTFYREMLGSVSMDDWPKQAWIYRQPVFAASVRDPEALPAVPDCEPQVGDSLEHQMR